MRNELPDAIPLGMEKEPLNANWNIKQNVFDLNGRRKTYDFHYTGGAPAGYSATANAIGDRAAGWADYKYAEGSWSPQQ